MLVEKHSDHAVREFGRDYVVIVKWTSSTRTRPVSKDMIKRIADKHQKSVQQVLLRWAVQYGEVGMGAEKKNLIAVIPGTGKPRHMASNLDIYNFVLDAGDMEYLSQEMRNDSEISEVVGGDDMVWPEGL